MLSAFCLFTCILFFLLVIMQLLSWVLQCLLLLWGKIINLGINRIYVFEVHLLQRQQRFVCSFICPLRRGDLAFKFIIVPNSSLNVSLAWFS